jgi:hypothetical protein
MQKGDPFVVLGLVHSEWMTPHEVNRSNSECKSERQKLIFSSARVEQQQPSPGEVDSV